MSTIVSDLIIESNKIKTLGGNVISLPDWGYVQLVGNTNPGSLSNKTIDATENNIVNITDNSIKSNAGISVNKLGWGTVGNQQLDCIRDVSGPVQAQLNAKIIPLSYINIGPAQKTKSTVYSVQTKFIFPGTDYVIPTKFKCVGEIDSGVTGQARIYHPGNTSVVCESPTFTGGEQIIDFGTISNLPAEESILEVQLKITSGVGNKFAWLHALNIYY